MLVEARGFSSPELELLVVVPSQTRKLGTELGSPVRAAPALTAEPSLQLSGF